MGKAFVAKLAKEGARDPEALAAWIGRRKFGRKVFQRLAKTGRDDAQEQRALMGRVRPSGSLSRDLTGFSDTELGRALAELAPDEAAQVAAEMDRRDAAGRLPGARPDLIGLSDEELGRALAEGADVAAIAEEADRRQRIAEVFPGSQLADDLSGMDEDTLGWALRYARPEEAERIAAEMDRRHPPAPLPQASQSGTVAGHLADRDAMDRALGPIASPDEWASLLADLPDDPRAGMSAAERWVADREEAQAAARSAYTREQIREMHREYVYTQWLKAEEECRGYLLTKRAELDGVDPVSLFSGPAHVAYARASDELKSWWQNNPRLSLAEYEEQARSVRSDAAETARQSAWGQRQRI